MPSQDEFIAHLYEAGAVDINMTLFKLVLTGNRSVPVRIINMAARLHDRRGLSGEGSVTTPGPQGAESSLPVGFDLDGGNLHARKMVSGTLSVTGDIFGDNYFSGTTVPLKRDEQVVFSVIARTLEHYVEWFIDIDLLVDGESKTVSVGVGGDRPITTTAVFSAHGDATAPDESRYLEVYLDSVFSPDQGGGAVNGDGSTRFVRVK